MKTSRVSRASVEARRRAGLDDDVECLKRIAAHPLFMEIFGEELRGSGSDKDEPPAMRALVLAVNRVDDLNETTIGPAIKRIERKLNEAGR